MPSILIADASKPSVVMTSEIFKDKFPGITIHVADSGRAALEMLATCQYFETNILDLNKTYTRDVYVLNSFVVYMCVSGSASITCGNNQSESITKGETVLIPAGIDNVTIEPKSEAKLLEVYVKS